MAVNNICMRCGDHVATHLVELHRFGVVTRVALCDECYEKVGENLTAFVSYSDVFGFPASRAELVCPSCGMKFSSYQKTGLLGCPDCYTVFWNQLESQIKNIQGSVYHTGKVKKPDDGEDLMTEINELQKRIETAVKEKNYLEADRLNNILEKVMAEKSGKEGGERE
ncbi:MAG: hypothetical protein LUD29_04190 [Clostridia bacterium]|nr:hypothetical protein [Clostridia bacterium]